MTKTKTTPTLRDRHGHPICVCREWAPKRFWVDGAGQAFEDTGRYRNVCTVCTGRVYVTKPAKGA